MKSTDVYYVRLGLQAGASKEAIRSRYKFLCHAYHPDKFSSSTHKIEAEAEFKIITEAYQMLMDESFATSRVRKSDSHKNVENSRFIYSINDLVDLQSEYYDDDEVSLSDWLKVRMGIAMCERLERILNVLESKGMESQ